MRIVPASKVPALGLKVMLVTAEVTEVKVVLVSVIEKEGVEDDCVLTKIAKLVANSIFISPYNPLPALTKSSEQTT
jgi:hypothetical protein